MSKNPELAVKNWLEQAREDLQSAEALLKANRYTWCAFICQQTLEKCLKAGFVSKFKKIPPYIHKLERLCQLIEISPPVKMLEDIIEIDKYYIASRYPSYVKTVNIRNQHKAEELFEKTKRVYKWIKENLKLGKK